jgi:uncharacterized membrane protein
MSVYTLMSDAAARPAAPPAGRQPLRARVKTPQSAQEAAGTLEKYIPAEVVALYTSILAFLVPANKTLDQQIYTSRWLVAVAVGVIAVIYAIGIYRRKRRAAHEPFEWPVALSKTAVVLIAFTAWVCVIPGSPFNSFSWYTPNTGAIIGLLVNAGLGAGALFFD